MTTAYPSIEGFVEIETQDDRPEMSSAEGSGYAIDDSELLGIVKREIEHSSGREWSRLTRAREAALEQYFGNPRGDEREGRSKVVTRDVFEQIEWAMPSMMEIFTSGPEVVKFMPVGPEDQDEAEQATAVCNKVFYQNGGFMILYTLIKDAFLSKLGTGKVIHDYAQRATHESYRGKNLLELQRLMADKDYRIRDFRAFWEDPQSGEIQELTQESSLPPGYDPMAVKYDIEGVRVEGRGKIVIDNIPPEEFFHNRAARSLDHPTCRFVAHQTPVSVSALLEQGYDEDAVRSIPSRQSPYDFTGETEARSSQDEGELFAYAERNDSERTVTLTEAYLLVDRDGDGISEWWKVCAGGDDPNVLLHTEPVSEHPFFSITPIPIPHRLQGQSLADVTGDLQEINTALWRQYLNSLYLGTDPRNIVKCAGVGETAEPLVNLSQLLNPTPGDYIEVYADGALTPYVQKTNAAEILPAFDVHAKMKETRTGISPEAMGINPDSISKHVYGTMVQASAAAVRLTLYARIFAETGIKAMFQKIYKEVIRNDMKDLIVRLRGEYVPVDPTSWRGELDCEVTVGLGHGSKLEKSSALQTILAIQEKMLQSGMTNVTSIENVYNAAATLTEALGFRHAEPYFTDPRTAPPPEPKPDPVQAALEIEQQTSMMKLELERQRIELERDKLLFENKKVELAHEIEVQKLRQAGYPATTDMPWRLTDPPVARPSAERAGGNGTDRPTDPAR
jgi:hypothetical protein